VEWTERARERLEIALTEAEVFGVFVAQPGVVEVRLHVSALPATGPMDLDPRRVLQFHGVTQLRFLLRQDTADGYGPAIPLPDLRSVEAFFDALATGGSFYGWRYFDDPTLTNGWPATPSLTVTLSEGLAPHTFYWFNVCTRSDDGDVRSYCIEGTIEFTDLSVARADGPPQDATEFSDEGVAWWQAFQDFDERAGLDAQRATATSGFTWKARPGILPSAASE
jgi:hypothetical protein